MDKLNKLAALNIIRTCIIDEQKEGYKSKYHTDDFIKLIFSLKNKYCDNLELDFIDFEDYDYNVLDKDTLLSQFEEKVIPIDYTDGYSIKYFMEDIEYCEDYVYIDFTKSCIVKWEDVYNDGLEHLLYRIDDYIKDIENDNE